MSDPDQPSEPRVARPLILAVVLLLGALSLWEVSEQDIYWQIRAGDELLRTWRFSEVESWSFAAAGEEWMNLQWLATLLFRAAFAFGPAGLVVARGLAVAALMLVTARLIAAHAGRVRPWLVVLTLLPLAYLAIVFRLQLRADTLVFIVFAFVLWWHADRPQHPRTPWVYLGAVVLAANLHPGTSPFVMLAAGWAIVTTDSPWRRRLVLLAALVPANFVAPYHVRVLPFLHRHFFYFEEQVLRNPDHQRFDPAVHLDLARFGVAGWAWLGLTLVGVIGLALAIRRDPRRGLLAAAIAAGLTWMCLERVRAFPYQVLFLLPFVARAQAALLARLVHGDDVGPVRRALAWLPSAAVLLTLLPYHAATTPRTLGLGESRETFPIDSVQFIRDHPIQPNLYHTFAFGAYTVWYLRDMPVFVDPRETPFRKLERDYLAAYQSPQHARALYDRLGVHAVLVPIPGTQAVPGLGHRDVIEEWLPRAQWAVVYWDDLSVLVVRRIPEHARLIAEHEYRYLRPNLPPGEFLAGGRARGIDEIRGFSREVQRCRRERPHDERCAAAERVVADLDRALAEAGAAR